MAYKSPNQLLQLTLNEFNTKIETEDLLKIPPSKATLIKQLSSKALRKDSVFGGLPWREILHDRTGNMMEPDSAESSVHQSARPSTSHSENEERDTLGSLAETDAGADHTFQVFSRYSTAQNSHAFKAFRRQSIQYTTAASSNDKSTTLNESDIVDQVFQLLKEKNIDIWKEGLQLGQELIKEVLKHPDMAFTRLINTQRSSKRTSEEDKKMSQLQDLKQTLAQRIIEQFGIQPLNDHPPLKFSSRELQFNNQRNQVSTIIFIVTNFKPHAVHFQWMKKRSKFVFKKDYQEERFYFYPKKGVILPESQLEFKISFKSSSVGVFKESWYFTTRPKVLEEEEGLITFKGFSSSPDMFLEQKTSIEEALLKRQTESFFKSIVNEIIQIAFIRIEEEQKVKYSRLAEFLSLKRKFIAEHSDFPQMRFNYDIYLHMRVLYGEAFEKLEANDSDLSKEYPKYWDGSVFTLKELISCLDDKDYIQNKLIEIDSFLPKLTGPKDKDLIIWQAKESFFRIADTIVDISFALRAQQKLPLECASANKFSAVEPVAEVVLQEQVIHNDLKKNPKDAGGKGGAAAPPTSDKPGKGNTPPGSAIKGGKAPLPVDNKGKPGPAATMAAKKAEEEAAAAKALAEQVSEPAPKSPKSWTKDRKKRELNLRLSVENVISSYAREVVHALVDSFQ